MASGASRNRTGKFVNVQFWEALLSWRLSRFWPQELLLLLPRLPVCWEAEAGGLSSSDIAAVGGDGLRHGSERTQFLSAVLSIVELTCCQGLTPPTQPGRSSLFTTSDLSPFCGGREGHCGKEWRCGPGQGGLAVWGAACGMAAGGSPCVQGRLASSGGCLWNKRGAWDPTDCTGFQEAELAFSELGILSSAPQSQTETGTLSATCLTPGSTNFLCFSMILMTLIALKFNYTLNDLHLLKRIQLHEVRTFLENLEHKVTIIIYFVVFKVDLFPGVTLTCQRE